jgi:hypothetical protein
MTKINHTPMDTRTAFCANCQAETPHAITMDENQEGVLTCDCGRFIKIPAGMSKDDIDSHLEAHKESNQGQVTQERYEKAERDLVDLLKD